LNSFTEMDRIEKGFAAIKADPAKSEAMREGTGTTEDPRSHSFCE
jgi:hypothetical protein